ncbi:MAG: hypothetical protein Q9174_007286, partial [Haloplaca sp. 1 TL-2023]
MRELAPRESEVMDLDLGRIGFDSPIVTINVSKEAKAMTEHTEHLAQSPVFQTMLDSKSKFKEAASLQ